MPTKERRSDTELRFRCIEPVFLVAVPLEHLAEDQVRITPLLADTAWLDTLVEQGQEPEKSRADFAIHLDLPEYPSSPSPEKQPISDYYFATHRSVVLEPSSVPSRTTSEMAALSMAIRVFETGALTARCSFGPRERETAHNLDHSVTMVRDARRLARQLMYSEIDRFIAFWNRCFPHCQLRQSNSFTDATVLFEFYEYVDFDLIPTASEFSLAELADASTGLTELRQLRGFCGMAKPYTWHGYSRKTLDEFVTGNLGRRDDELWFADAQRFMRYFPNREVPETTAFARDLLLAIEFLLGLRAVYKSLLDQARSRLSSLPQELTRSSGATAKPPTVAELRRLQDEMAELAYRLSRSQFPPIVRFYAGTGFVAAMLGKIEEVLQLEGLSESLMSEMQKLNGVLDSFQAVMSSRLNLQLQRRILVLTGLAVLIGALAIALSLFQATATMGDGTPSSASPQVTSGFSPDSQVDGKTVLGSFDDSLHSDIWADSINAPPEEEPPTN